MGLFNFPTTAGISNVSGSDGSKSTRSAKQILSQIFGRIGKLLNALSRGGSSDRMGSRNMVWNVILDKKVEIVFGDDFVSKNALHLLVFFTFLLLFMLFLSIS